VRLRWSVDNAASPDQFDDLGFTALGGDDWEVSIPALSDGSYLRYLIEVIDDSGDVVRSLPEGSATDPWYGAWVGGEPLWENDFEDGDGGFDSALIEGDDQESANDWMRETPKGDGGDPNGAASGDFAWGNDLQPQEDWNGEYQNEVHNVLRSGRIEVGDGPVHLQFRRWLTVEDGLFDRAWVEVNGTLIWENIAGANQNDASSNHEDTHWAFRSYNVTDLVDEGAIEVEWHLETDQGLTMGGWTIDDVRVLASEGGEVLDSEGSACTCSSGTPSSAPWSLSLLLLGAAGVLVRRRRH
jgi:MYXO-CTERM domain-containing protein